jgi:hypothetical protein
MPVANMSRPKIALIMGVLMGIGIGAVAIGLNQWASIAYSYRTLRDERLASLYLDLVSIGVFSLIMGLLAIKYPYPFGLLNSKSPNAKLVGGLIGGGGTIALLSLQNLFYFLPSQDYFSLELFAAEVSIGLFLVLLAAAVNRRR